MLTHQLQACCRHTEAIFVRSSSWFFDCFSRSVCQDKTVSTVVSSISCTETSCFYFFFLRPSELDSGVRISERALPNGIGA